MAEKLYWFLVGAMIAASLAFSFGGSGSQFVTNEQVTAENMNEIDAAFDAVEAEIANDLDQTIPVITTTAVSPQRIPRNDWETWFAIDGQASPVEGEGGSTLKTTVTMLETLVVSLTETEAFHTLFELILGGDGDGVGYFMNVYCTGGSHAGGNEGCQGFRSRVSDVWITAFGTFSENITSGAGSQTASVAGVSEAESKMLGENKLIVFTNSAVTVDVVDAPPGTLNAGVLEDPGDSWSFDGTATGQGVFTLGSGEVTSSGVAADSWCLSAVDSDYVDINSQASHLWLIIDQANSGDDTVRTRWENQGYNGKTPFPMLVGEGDDEAILAPCAQLGPPTFADSDHVVDSLTLVKGDGFPAISSGAASTFEVSAYPNTNEAGFRSLMSNRLGSMYGGAGFIAANQIGDTPNSGRFEFRAAFDVDVTGDTENLAPGQHHGWETAIGCETPGECERLFIFDYAPDPTDSNFDQWLGELDWSSEDWADDLDRIVIAIADDSTKNLTLDATDGWGANGDSFMRESNFTVGTTTPTDGSTPCNTGNRYIETDRRISWYCTDGATDDWWGVQMLDDVP